MLCFLHDLVVLSGFAFSQFTKGQLGVKFKPFSKVKRLEKNLNNLLILHFNYMVHLSMRVKRCLAIGC